MIGYILNDVVVYFKGPYRHCFVDTEKQYKDNEQQHKNNEQQHQDTEEQYKDNTEQQRDSEKRHKDTDLSYDSNRPEVRIRYFHRNTVHHRHYTNCLGMMVMVNVGKGQCECLDISLDKGQTLERAIQQSSFL